MGNIATEFLRQTAVYWSIKKRKNQYGQREYNDPIQIPVRWSGEFTEFIDEKGEKQVASAKVMVDRKLDIGGLLFLGTLADVEEEDFPESPEDGGALAIRGFKEIPSIDATVIVRVAFV